MTRVKICGITNREDAQLSAQCGADAIGFNFAEESPRRIASERAREIACDLEPFVSTVGIFVDSPVEEVRGALEMGCCRIVQLHGDESADYVRSLAPHPVIKVVRVRGRLDADRVGRYKGARAILLDTYVPGRAGGTGRRFDPAVAVRLVQEGWRVIMAGGLTPENVAEVVSSVRPYAVDVSSGVEAAPGRKDHDKVARFIAAVRAADRAAP
jgi:phosphoribosylanthranilate isomerase